jgi:hypothetical protein
MAGRGSFFLQDMQLAAFKEKMSPRGAQLAEKHSPRNGKKHKEKLSIPESGTLLQALTANKRGRKSSMIVPKPTVSRVAFSQLNSENLIQNRHRNVIPGQGGFTSPRAHRQFSVVDGRVMELVAPEPKKPVPLVVDLMNAAIGSNPGNKIEEWLRTHIRAFNALFIEHVRFTFKIIFRASSVPDMDPIHMSAYTQSPRKTMRDEVEEEDDDEDDDSYLFDPITKRTFVKTHTVTMEHDDSEHDDSEKDNDSEADSIDAALGNSDSMPNTDEPAPKFWEQRLHKRVDGLWQLCNALAEFEWGDRIHNCSAAIYGYNLILPLLQQDVHTFMRESIRNSARLAKTTRATFQRMAEMSRANCLAQSSDELSYYVAENSSEREKFEERLVFWDGVHESQRPKDAQYVHQIYNLSIVQDTVPRDHGSDSGSGYDSLGSPMGSPRRLMPNMLAGLNAVPHIIDEESHSDGDDDGDGDEDASQQLLGSGSDGDGVAGPSDANPISPRLIITPHDAEEDGDVGSSPLLESPDHHGGGATVFGGSAAENMSDSDHGRSSNLPAPRLLSSDEENDSGDGHDRASRKTKAAAKNRSAKVLPSSTSKPQTMQLPEAKQPTTNTGSVPALSGNLDDRDTAILKPTAARLALRDEKSRHKKHHKKHRKKGGDDGGGDGGDENFENSMAAMIRARKRKDQRKRRQDAEELGDDAPSKGKRKHKNKHRKKKKKAAAGK